MARVDLYYGREYYEQTEAKVASMHLDNHMVAQVSQTPDGTGFLIRVWPKDGLEEYGGNNGTVISLVVQDDVLISLHHDERLS